MPLDEEYALYVAADAIVFTVKENRLCVLLITNKFPPFQDKFAFPGGRVRRDEEMRVAVARELYEETGVKDIFLKQFHAYGRLNRDPRNRVIAVVFLAFIDWKTVELHGMSDAKSATWVPVQDVGELAYDHNRILADALAELRLEIQTTNIAAQILPATFTMTELQTLYEEVLGKPLDKRNFRKRVAELGMVLETGEERRGGAHRPAKLYRFAQKDYQPLRDRISIFT